MKEEQEGEETRKNLEGGRRRSIIEKQTLIKTSSYIERTEIKAPAKRVLAYSVRRRKMNSLSSDITTNTTTTTTSSRTRKSNKQRLSVAEGSGGGDGGGTEMRNPWMDGTELSSSGRCCNCCDRHPLFLPSSPSSSSPPLPCSSSYPLPESSSNHISQNFNRQKRNCPKISYPLGSVSVARAQLPLHAYLQIVVALLLGLIASSQFVSCLDQNNTDGTTTTTTSNNSSQQSQRCLPLIGAFFNSRCSNQTEPAAAAPLTTISTTAATITMRYESLKVSQSEPPPIELLENATATRGSGPIQSLPAATSNPRQSKVIASGGAALNVLCNSRCKCVILDFSSSLSQRQMPPPLPTSSSSSSSNSNSSTSMMIELTKGGSGASTPNNDEEKQNASQALIAFNEDYSLDYEQSSVVATQTGNAQALDEQQQPAGASDALGESAGATLLAGGKLVDPPQRPSAGFDSSATEGSSRWRQSQLQLKSSGGGGPSAGPLFPLQHQPHAGSGGHASPPQLYAQSLFSSQAPKLSYHAHAPYLKMSPNGRDVVVSSSLVNAPTSSPNQVPEPHSATSQQSQTNYHHYHHNLRTSYLQAKRHEHLQRASSSSSPSSSSSSSSPSSSASLVQNEDEPSASYFNLQVKQFWPLKIMNYSSFEPFKLDNLSSILSMNYNNNSIADLLLNELDEMLIKIEEDNVQSLSLSHNMLEFEFWSELYALLAGPFRRNIYHLDLSHNNLVKLGITFTGYLEHHLVAHDGYWPQQGTSTSATIKPNISQLNELTSGATSGSIVTNIIIKKPSASSQRTKPMRSNSLFSGGRLYTLIQMRLLKSNRVLHLPGQQQQQQQQMTENHTTNRSVDNPTSSILRGTLMQPMLIRALDLSHNKLKWLINDQFKALKHLQTIRLDHNKIRYIHQHAFSGLESLRFLNLNFNRLQLIYIEQFQTNYNLLSLMLRSNYLSYLRGGSFASLANMKRLDLSMNKLTILSNNAFIGLESLELLNLSSNQFIHVPSGSFHPLTNLKQLDLSDNLLTELAPGTFFHLGVEELWLNQNDQLVSIERGALWDLPYLKRLHLRSNPMLMKINSQAFVSTQSLQFIDTEDCQSLDSIGKELLDNITMTATSRQLRLEQMNSPTNETTKSSSSSDLVSASAITNQGPTDVLQIRRNNSQTTSTDHHQGPQLAELSSQVRNSNNLITNMGKQQSKNLTKYLYYMGTITLLICALKLVFKYTSTSHYLETRRRRRRVYELNAMQAPISPISASNSDNSMSASNQIIDHHHSATNSDRKLESTSSSVQDLSCSSEPISDAVQAEGTVFELCERANNVIQHPFPHQFQINNNHELTDQQQQQQTLDQGSLNISVINVSPSSLAEDPCCPDCNNNNNNTGGVAREAPPVLSMDGHDEKRGIDQDTGRGCCSIQMGIGHDPLSSEGGNNDSNDNDSTNNERKVSVQAAGAGPLQASASSSSSSPSLDLIHSQLIAADFDYGHANCAHFYQSLGPALQLADITANLVNNMDYY